MSQSGLARIASGALPPNVPLSFVTDSGTATPALNILNILGTTSVAGSTPVSTSAPGPSNTVDVIVQRSQAIAASDSTKIGLAAFNSASFTVDANGFVSLSGLGGNGPFVSAYLNTSVANFTGDNTSAVVVFDTVTADATASYNPAIGVFTAPISGNYQITATVTYSSVNATYTLGNLQIATSGAANTQMFVTCNPGKLFNVNNNYTSTVTANIGIVAGTTVSINTRISGGAKTVGLSGALFGVFTYLNIVYIRP